MKDNQKKVKEIKNLEKYGNFVDISGSSVGEVEKNTDLDDFDSESFITLEEIQRQKIKKNRSKQVEKNQKKIDSEIEKNHKQIQRKIKKNLKLAANASKNEKKSSRKKNKGEVPVKAKKVSRLRTSIGAKLIFMISLVVVLSLLSVTFIVSYFVSEDVRISAEENNLTINARMSADCASRIDSVVSSIEMFISSLGETKDKNEEAKNASVFFEQYDDISSVILPDSQRVFNNTKFLTIHEIDFDKVSAYCESCEDEINNSRLGNFKLKNASSFFGKPMLAIYSPIQGSKTDSCVLILYSSESLYENFSSSSVNQSFYVNMEGEILVSPDLSVMLESQDWSENAVVKEMQSSKTDNGQKHYKIGDEKTDGAENIDGAGETNGTRGITFFTSLWEKIGFDLFNNDEYVGAFTKLTDSNSSVITTVELSVILEGVRRTTFRNLYLTGAILAIAIMIMWLYSRSISLPLKQLASVADEINQANFNTPLFDELETKSHDEVSVLVNSTKNEREILNTITKLTNIGVVKSVIRKEVDFEPHLKDITIFFSDIRGFTAISDGFNSRFGKKSGAEIIGFLNIKLFF